MSTEIQDRYDAMVGALRDSRFDAALALADGILAELSPPITDLEKAFVAGASYMRAQSLAQLGDRQEAMNGYAATSQQFGYSGDVHTQYWAAASDYAYALLLRDAGEFRAAHNLLDLSTLRTMMDDHPPTRSLSAEMRAFQQALQREHGFKTGDGLDEAAAGGPEQSSKPTAEMDTDRSKDEEYIFEKVESLFDKEPRQWRVNRQTLTIRQAGRNTAIPLADIAALRLSYAPTKFKAERYTAQIATRSGTRHMIDNMSFKGVGAFEARNSDFVIVMIFLALQLEKTGRPADIRGGVSWLYYLLACAVTIIILPLVLLMGISAGPIGMIILLVLTLLLGMRLFRWFRHNRPRRITSDSMANYLPRLWQ